MENNLVDITEVSMLQEAKELHHKIITSGIIAANSIVEMCKCLKQMRDRKQYIYLGYETFENYSEDACKIKARQAYNYISTYENLGPEFLQSNANLGITKLKLLSDIPESKREEVLENNDIDEMSTREIKDLVEKLNKAQEQISFLSNEVENKKEDTEEAISEKIKLQDEIENLQNTIKSLQDASKKPEIDEETLKIEYEAKTHKQLAAADKLSDSIKKEEIKKIEEKALKEKEIAVNQAKDEVKKEYQRQLEEIAREKEESLARANELEKKIGISANSDAIILAGLFEDLNYTFDKIRKIIERMPLDEKPKYLNAATKYLSVMQEKLGGQQNV